MSFPRYQSYKASGVEWLGEVPEHWGVTALKRGFNVTLGKMLQPESSSPDDELLPYLRAANIQWGGVDATDIKQMWVSKRDRAQLRLARGDLLVSEGGDVGRSCLWAAELDDCYFQNSVNRVRARDGHSNRYLYYWMSTIKDKGYIDVLCNKSTIAHFTAEKVAAVPVPLPPPTEQTQIAAFLDREKAKIDELVAEQRRLMELLKEKRQAIISHAVTQGLNPHAPMKPSGIEWLGEVPAHWEVTRLGWICSEINDINHVMPVAVENGVPFLSAKDLLDDGTLNFTTDIKMISEEDFATLSKKICPRRGDIIYSRIGACLGKARLVETDTRFLISYSCCVVRIVDERASRRFIQHLLDGEMILTEARMRTQGIGVPDLGLGEIGSFPVPLPPLSEQELIAAYLDEQAGKFDTLTTEAQRAIDLLQERRTALISAAVTGQIDVRGIQALP